MKIFKDPMFAFDSKQPT